MYTNIVMPTSTPLPQPVLRRPLPTVRVPISTTAGVRRSLKPRATLKGYMPTPARPAVQVMRTARRRILPPGMGRFVNAPQFNSYINGDALPKAIGMGRFVSAPQLTAYPNGDSMPNIGMGCCSKKALVQQTLGRALAKRRRGMRGLGDDGDITDAFDNPPIYDPTTIDVTASGAQVPTIDMSSTGDIPYVTYPDLTPTPVASGTLIPASQNPSITMGPESFAEQLVNALLPGIQAGASKALQPVGAQRAVAPGTGVFGSLGTTLSAPISQGLSIPTWMALAGGGLLLLLVFKPTPRFKRR